mgnify:CR=1 FL=1
MAFLALAAWTALAGRRGATVPFTVRPRIGVGVAAVLLAVASDGVPTLRRALTGRAAVHIGRVSYGTYLLHPFVLAGLRAVWPALPVPPPAAGPATALAAFVVGPAIAVAVATLVWRTIEAPVLAQKDRLAPYSADPR